MKLVTKEFVQRFTELNKKQRELSQELHATKFEKLLMLKEIAQQLRRDFGVKSYQIMKMRQEGHSLEEIGKVFGVTRERIRQIENNILGFITE